MARDGTFQSPIDNQSFVGASELALGDFNNDGKLDVVAVGSFFGSADYGILLGNGNGTLQAPLTYPLVDVPGAVATADLNRDGNLDLAVGGYIGGGVNLFLGQGDGTFEAPIIYASNTGGPVVIADFNGDGNLDMVIGSGAAAGVQEFLGLGSGSFSPPLQYDSGTGGIPIAVDLNGDGRPDLALMGGELGVTAMLNTSALTFTPSSPLLFPAQLLNTISPPQTLILTNSGTESISLAPPTWAGNFGVSNGCGKSIKPGASCTFAVTFRPKSVGPLRGSITLRDSALPQPQKILLSGQATPLQVSPAQLNFPHQTVGTTSPPQTIAVVNVSSVTMPLTPIEIGGPDGNDFHQTNNCGSQIEPGASCSISVTFTPHKSGGRSGNVDFTVSDPLSRYKVILRGTGV